MVNISVMDNHFLNSPSFKKLNTPGLEINRSPPVVTDVPPKPHRWTTAVASADFAVATGGPPVEVLTVTPVAHRRFHKSANFVEIIGFKSISEYNSYHYIWIH